MKREINWPKGRKAACMVTVELDAQFIWLGTDPTNVNRPKTLSMGTYGMLRGFGRVMEALDKFGVKATFFVPGKAAEEYPHQVKEAAAAGHEIALHGYGHENFGLITSKEQEDAVQKGMRALEKATGKRPAGFRLPEGNMTPETMGILQRAGLLYDSSLLDSDLPYALEGGMVEIPMRWDLQDFPYFAFNYHPPMPVGACRIANYSEVLSIWQEELAGYSEYGLCYVCKFDPQCIGTPGRILLLERLLEDIAGRDLWVATGSEIANHYLQTANQ